LYIQRWNNLNFKEKDIRCLW